MPTAYRWERRSPGSANDFDLVLANPQKLDSGRSNGLLDGILGESHRGLTLSSRASKEFRRWIGQPDTPLRSAAYVMLSNWFMTQSGDRRSRVASRCEALWDELFPCRPLERLSSPEPGLNHVMVPAEFESFWRRVLVAQGEPVGEAGIVAASTEVKSDLRTSDLPQATVASTSGHLRAMLDKGGLHIEVEGSAPELAAFLRIVSGWERE
jgi:hypothetical protein